jgi:hypothetical protein
MLNLVPYHVAVVSTGGGGFVRTGERLLAEVDNLAEFIVARGVEYARVEFLKLI